MNAYVLLSVLIDIIAGDRTYEALEGVSDIIANNAAKTTQRRRPKRSLVSKPLLTSADAHT
jgi:hypothetical protein